MLQCLYCAQGAAEAEGQFSLGALTADEEAATKCQIFPVLQIALLLVLVHMPRSNVKERLSGRCPAERLSSCQRAA